MLCSLYIKLNWMKVIAKCGSIFTPPPMRVMTIIISKYNIKYFLAEDKVQVTIHTSLLNKCEICLLVAYRNQHVLVFAMFLLDIVCLQLTMLLCKHFLYFLSHTQQSATVNTAYLHWELQLCKLSIRSL